ncbi:serine O-acetyltransferase EpsC [Emticicia sp. 17c]|uniref:serine O-acetyltransferase EpsC n=1 Tax=Emticicia sp. 17c TaxID=3127704 RepID=UPI00301E3D88
MNKLFFQHIFDKHQHTEPVPPTKEIANWALRIIRLLFPEQTKEYFRSEEEIEIQFKNLELELRNILISTYQCKDCNPEWKANEFFEKIPKIYETLRTDIKAIIEGDPAARSEFEVVRAYPGFYAISFYRLAHELHLLQIPLLPRILTEYAHSKTGIDIHPGAKIDESFFIDHGTGVVIGETTIIGKNVKLYQGVTLGALSVEKSMANSKRHPTVENNVVIYSGATILGGNTIIGQHSIIGGNVWLTKSVPAYSTVYHKPEIKVVEREIV